MSLDENFDDFEDLNYRFCVNKNKNKKRTNKNDKNDNNPSPPKRLKTTTINSSDDYDKFIKLWGHNDEPNDDSDDEEPECNNPLCDHEDFLEDEEEEPDNKRPIQIKTIDDIIDLGKTYHCKKNKIYFGINLRLLCNLVPPLTELKKMIGMTEVKENIVNQIVFFLQGFNKSDSCGECFDCSYDLPCMKNINNDMLHTVITGPPGVGKTELGKILGKVYKAMGVLSKGHVKVVSRSDLIGKYLGHTAAKTQGVIDQCKGGVMFIDEAYALGNEEGRDSFSKECLDTLNQNLSERRDFLCIIAGYKDALDKCFFKYNEGLKRRFTFRYDIKNYDGKELKSIFEIKIKKEGWDLEYIVKSTDKTKATKNKHKIEEKITSFFEKNLNYFPHFGGDIETLFLNCKIFHGKRVVFLEQSAKKLLTEEDIKNGFEIFIANRKYKDNDNVSVWS